MREVGNLKMVAASTLKSYIKRCDNALSLSDRQSAETLAKEIVSVFRSDFKGMTQELDMYSPAVLNGNNTVDYIGDVGLLRARLQKELDVMEAMAPAKEQPEERKKKIFISHASKDKEYVAAIVNLLESLGLREDEIICSSIPPYCVPLDNNVYDWLVNEFQNSDLHMVFALSKTYYSRPTCLNEMGAAWAMKHKWTAILLPGFEFSEIAGCIDPAQASIKLDDADRDTLNFRLGELKNNLIAEFGLRTITSDLWEKKRNTFLKRIEEVIQEKSQKNPEEEHSPLVKRATLEKDEGVLLVYAADDPHGQIMMIRSISRSGPSISTHDCEFNNQDTAREAARWKGALERLERYGLVEAASYKREVFTVTDKGYKVAEQAKEQWGIDTRQSPKEYIGSKDNSIPKEN